MGLFGGAPEGASDSKLRSFDSDGDRSLDFGGSAGGSALGGGDLEQQVAIAQQSLQLTQQCHKLNDLCFDLCVTGSPSTYLSGREESCLTNCVDRFIDTTMLITNRFAQLAQKMGR